MSHNSSSSSFVYDCLTHLARNLSFMGDIKQDVPAFLHYHGYHKTAIHCQDVAAEARRIALQVGVDPEKAEIAGLLHDVSGVFPVSDRVHVAHQLGLEVCEEEEAFPLIVHQKISRVMSQYIFGVTDALILEAVECHTTLRASPTRLDKLLFVADKIAWDQEGSPPYLPSLCAALDQSLDHAAAFFVNYLWEKRQSLLVIHPWLRQAYHDLECWLPA